MIKCKTCESSLLYMGKGIVSCECDLKMRKLDKEPYYANIPLRQCFIDQRDIRPNYPTSLFNDLQKSIKEKGLLMAIEVYENDINNNTFMIMNGWQRFKACANLHHIWIPAYICIYDQEKIEAFRSIRSF